MCRSKSSSKKTEVRLKPLFRCTVTTAFIAHFAVFAAVFANPAGNQAAASPSTPPPAIEKTWPCEIPKDCPIPRSEAFTGLSLTGRYVNYGNADTWYPSWGADDRLYSPFTDGFVTVPGANGKPVIVDSRSGRGASAVVGHAIIAGDDPTQLNILEPALIKGSALPYGGRYPCASLHHNGFWYIGSYACNPGSGQAWGICGPFAGFHISKDNGKTWTPSPRSCAPGKGVFPEPAKLNGPVKFAVPHVVDFGKNMEHSPDGLMYMVAHGATQAEGVDRKCNCGWLTGDQIYLCRVKPSPETVNDGANYEYYAGRDAADKPAWTKALAQAKPVLDWNNHCGNVSITYNPPLKKYLMCVNNADDTMGPNYKTFILESDAITGPWKIVTYMKAFGTQGYFANIPAKFISADGRTFWLCYSANWTDETSARKKLPPALKSNPPGSSYTLTLQEVRLETPNRKIR